MNHPPDPPAYTLGCDVCNRQDCDPRRMLVWPVWRRLEENRRSEPPIEEGREVIPFRGGDLTRRAVEAMDEDELAACGLTPPDRKELLQVGRIVVGGTLVCAGCILVDRARRLNRARRRRDGGKA